MSSPFGVRLEVLTPKTFISFGLALTFASGLSWFSRNFGYAESDIKQNQESIIHLQHELEKEREARLSQEQRTWQQLNVIVEKTARIEGYVHTILENQKKQR